MSAGAGAGRTAVALPASVAAPARRSCRTRAIRPSRSRMLTVARLAWGALGAGDTAAVPRRSSGESRACRFRPARARGRAWPGASPRLVPELTSRDHLPGRIRATGHVSPRICRRGLTRSEGDSLRRLREPRGRKTTRTFTVAPEPAAVSGSRSVAWPVAGVRWAKAERATTSQ
jgi:hypothetical protein